jgi:uncharacterized protein YxeA
MKTTLAILIIIIVIAIIGGAYYVDVNHVLAPTTSSSTPMVASTTTTTATTSTASNPSTNSNYYTDVSTWQTSTETQAGLSIAYPLDFTIDETNSTAPNDNWRLNQQDPGVLVLTITVPKAFEPQTNFADATLTVGYSQNSDAIANCLVEDPGDGPATATSSAVINGINFTVFNSSDVGAGNIYKTVSYRTLHAGSCYAVEYTVHSAELGNFPPSYDLTQYSDPQIDDVMNRVVGTFKFL